MAKPARKKPVYDDLYTIPDNMIGEIIDGELIVTPRPSRKHAYAATTLIGEVEPPYHRGRGGPGGWIFLAGPEIGLGEHVPMVPDLAGWKAERFPDEEPHNWISAAPDWICEILSPRTMRLDKTKKMPIYAEHGIAYLWLIEPEAKTLVVYRLNNGEWVVAGMFAENTLIRAEPFAQIEINLNDLWREPKG